MQFKASVAIKRFLVVSVTAFLLVVNVLVVSLMTMVTVSQAASPGDIVINEIMYDPKTPEDKREWFELANTTASDIDINGWTFAEVDGSPSFTISGSTIVPANGFLVLAINGDPAQNGGISGAYDYANTFTLSNGGDSIVVKDNLSNEIDRVVYSDGGLWPASTDGTSIEYDGAGDNNDGSNWALATTAFGDADQKGTPGERNGNAPTAVTLSSFTAHPIPSQATFFYRQWVALACAAGLVFGGSAAARRWLGR